MESAKKIERMKGIQCLEDLPRLYTDAALVAPVWWARVVRGQASCLPSSGQYHLRSRAVEEPKEGFAGSFVRIFLKGFVVCGGD
jgi:hypothetical protein